MNHRDISTTISLPVGWVYEVLCNNANEDGIVNQYLSVLVQHAKANHQRPDREYIRKLVTELARLGFIEILSETNKNGQIRVIPVSTRDTEFVQRMLNDNPLGKSIEEQARTLHRTPTGVLIDWDNLYHTSLTEGLRIYDLLPFVRDALRSLGSIKTCQVFIKTSQLASTPGVDRLFWEQNMIPVACPERHKDKDQVDMKIRALFHQIIETTLMSRIVIVSSDSDFSDLEAVALDRRIQLIRVRPDQIFRCIEKKIPLVALVEEATIRERPWSESISEQWVISMQTMRTAYRVRFESREDDKDTSALGSPEEYAFLKIFLLLHSGGLLSEVSTGFSQICYAIEKNVVGMCRSLDLNSFCIAKAALSLCLELKLITSSRIGGSTARVYALNHDHAFLPTVLEVAQTIPEPVVTHVDPADLATGPVPVASNGAHHPPEAV